MSASAAEDEFALMIESSKAGGSRSHPEDFLEEKSGKSTTSSSPRASDSNHSSGDELDEIDDAGNSSDEGVKRFSKRSTVHKKSTSRLSTAPSIRPSSIIDSMPQYRLASYGAANTGPKGVLADAKSFEQARRRELQAR